MDIYGKREVNQIIGQKCDNCGKSTEDGEFVPIRIEFSYGHDLDGVYYDFCDYKCLLKFILNEMKKENPRTDIIYGRKMRIKFMNFFVEFLMNVAKNGLKIIY